MFSQFFSLTDSPFKAAFDPAYLFTGRHHEEALAHLRYAVSEGEGFTVITGERGVGKSTICRIFMQGMEDRAPKAFLVGPLATPKELMRRINQQFGLRPETDSIKVLSDALNQFLIQQRLGGRRVTVFIDDAQVLSPEVLEQVRLLSNLETTRDKLIQIVLIGEPELMRLLDSHALRQMGQRVSVCYEIGPLTKDETAAYIQHRLSIAAQGPPLRFEPAVVRHIFRYSGGNPRLINQAGHAVLSAAYRARQKEITADTAAMAIQDLRRLEVPGAEKHPLPKAFIRGLVVAAALMAAVGAFLVLRPAGEPPRTEPAAALAPSASSAVVQPEPAKPAKEDPAPGDRIPPEPDPAPVAKAAVPVNERPTPPSAAAAHPTMTHSVQVGAYLQPENARQMVVRLTSKGYPARILKITDSSARIWHVVRIGDHPSRQAAQSQAEEFRRRENLDCVIRPYEAF
jgi:general secretion pathway protein A